MVIVFHHTPVNTVLFLNNLMGKILMVWLENIKNIKISPVKILRYTVYDFLLYFEWADQMLRHFCI